MAPVPNSTTTGGPKTQNRSIHFLCRSWLANEEAVSHSIVRHQSACFHFRRTTGHTVSIRNVERSRHILRMPFVTQGACPLLIPFILSDASHVTLSECMVRRRVASEKRKMAVGLRQCIRPLVESSTPGHDGYPLALVRIMGTVWEGPFPISGFESVGET